MQGYHGGAECRVQLLVEHRVTMGYNIILQAAGSLLGFAQPVCFTLRGMAALDSLRSFLSFHSFIHQGLPFGHRYPSLWLWSPMSIPLVTKV